MPRGQHPNSKKNLEKNHDPNRARINGAKGGRKTAQIRKECANFKECFATNMTPEKRQELFEVIWNMARRGNLKAFEIIRDQLGEKPVEKIEQTNTNVVIDFGDIEGDG